MTASTDPDDLRAQYLRVYDEQLRTDAETPSAVAVTLAGPLRLVTFAGGRAFVTYRDLGGADEAAIDALVAAARAHFDADPELRKVEWKTRGHDRAPGLHEALLRHGFAAEETESIMIGPLEALTRDAPVPDGATLRRVVDEPDVRAFSAMIDAAFGEDVDTDIADALVARLARGDGMELWVAEVDGRMVGGGRLEPVADSDVVGVWGGAVLEEYRGRGIYRALTAARAASALESGRTLVHSDSTEYSRPILERSGLVKVSTTTPYLWRRP
ncbi:acetyltransferase (GNAT) family protein [Rathayibacter sp. PhB152]|uniref:GNAT family N-acetyltransferase n=1 Tax=Rathayibacter sp. PhB152 TaxID=2485190 RepID=UPI000F4D0CB0|nr:GNAT family N-acetyltransferase [Rathayibacter sp. PhB152]ROQ64866.1 acetyltransferase (GNAT) family protein [Rathayibacter sp. PhB152]